MLSTQLSELSPSESVVVTSSTLLSVSVSVSSFFCFLLAVIRGFGTISGALA
jgi:hypothetical protein